MVEFTQRNPISSLKKVCFHRYLSLAYQSKSQLIWTAQLSPSHRITRQHLPIKEVLGDVSVPQQLSFLF